jgi:hypothetical protein
LPISARNAVGERLMLAALAGVTGVVGAWLTIVTLKGLRAAFAFARRTNITQGALVLVIAVQGVRWVGAPGVRVALICGALVLVIAVGGGAANAQATLTGVRERARVEVVTGVAVVCGRASQQSVAGIFAAGVFIIANEPREGYAGPFEAGLRYAAGVPVVTGRVVVGVEAAKGIVADVIGAGVGVITREDLRGHTEQSCAVISQGAGRTVIAGPHEGLMHASLVAVAHIGSAGVLVIALRCLAWLAAQR